MSQISLSDLKFSVIGDPSTWAASNANALAGFLLENLLPGVVEEVRRDTNMWNMFVEDTQTKWKGGVARFHVNMRRDSSMHITTDGGPILDGNHPTPVRGQVSEKYFVAQMALTDGALASAGGGDATEIVDTIVYHLEGLRDDFQENISRELYLNGDGVLYTIGDHDAGAADGVAMTPATGTGAQYVYADMQVELWNAARTTNKGTFFVTDVLPDGTLSLTNVKGGTPGATVPATIADTDVLCRRGSQDGAGGLGHLLGLGVHVDDGTLATNHESISRDEYPEWRATVIDGTGALDSRKLHNLFQAVRTASRRSPGTAVMNNFMQTEYSELFQPAVQSTPGGPAILGFTGSKFQSGDMTYDFVIDDAAPYDTIWALAKETFKFLAKKPLGPRAQHLSSSAGEMGAMFQASADRLNYEGALLMIGEFICTACRRNGKLENLTVSPQVLTLP